MSKVYLIIIIVILGVLSLFTLRKTYEEFTLPKVAVTIYPFYDIVKEIVGDKFEVVLIVPPGAEPHNFELRPQDIFKLRGTRIIFSHGLIIDDWTKNLTQNLKSAKVISLYQNINLIDQDPHFWLSIENMKKVAQKVAKEMENFDPQNKDYYEKNLENVLNKLNELSKFAQDISKNFSSRYLITQHNAFKYLAQELNLNIIGFLEGSNKELTPAELQKLIDAIRILNIKVIFKEPGEESNLLKTLAKEFNLKIYELDPIEGKSGLNYFDAYRKNIETLKEALKF
jgi:zinc transport system substrate-binding protein